MRFLASAGERRRIHLMRTEGTRHRNSSSRVVPSAWFATAFSIDVEPARRRTLADRWTHESRGRIPGGGRPPSARARWRSHPRRQNRRGDGAIPPPSCRRSHTLCTGDCSRAQPIRSPERKTARRADPAPLRPARRESIRHASTRLHRTRPRSRAFLRHCVQPWTPAFECLFSSADGGGACEFSARQATRCCAAAPGRRSRQAALRQPCTSARRVEFQAYVRRYSRS